MSEENWHRIPRKQISWSPSINYDKCISRGKCVEYCTLVTYAFEEKDGVKRLVAKKTQTTVKSYAQAAIQYVPLKPLTLF